METTETTETFDRLVRAEFRPRGSYLNTASTGLLPARTVTALQEAALPRAEGPAAAAAVRGGGGVPGRVRPAAASPSPGSRRAPPSPRTPV